MAYSLVKNSSAMKSLKTVWLLGPLFVIGSSIWLFKDIFQHEQKSPRPILDQSLVASRSEQLSMHHSENGIINATTNDSNGRPALPHTNGNNANKSSVRYVKKQQHLLTNFSLINPIGRLESLLKTTTLLHLIREEMRNKNQSRLREHSIVSSKGLKDIENNRRGPLPSTRKILLWNSPDFYFGTGRTPFLQAKCPINDCYITNNRKEIDYSELDAVVWRPDGPDTSLPPPFRSVHTRFVYFLWEPPGFKKTLLKKLEGVVNYTMTYRRDSDIYNPFGFFVPLSSPRTELLNKDYAQGKTKFAAWFVSNCKPKSERQKLVKQLSRYFSVEVYGKCGPLKCSKTNIEKCYEDAARTYKFYFSFENSLCDDYITEKFFRTSKYDILPVTYGLGSYDELAPPHSFINALDFASVRHLADYLIYLDKNHTAYNEYFRWKVHYEAVHSRSDSYSYHQNISWCQLCKKLHTDMDVKVHPDLNEWLENSYSCVWPNKDPLRRFLSGETLN